MHAGHGLEIVVAVMRGRAAAFEIEVIAENAMELAVAIARRRRQHATARRPPPSTAQEAPARRSPHTSPVSKFFAGEKSFAFGATN